MSPSKQFHSPEGIAAPIGNGYTHAITAGGTIYVSGQIGMDPSGTIPEGFEAQTQRAFENLKAVLAAAGASLSDIVKVTVLLVELSDLAAYRDVRETYLPHLPALSHGRLRRRAAASSRRPQRRDGAAVS
jgi:2-iminobutanoate/2-iminopropanoate deaminase